MKRFFKNPIMAGINLDHYKIQKTNENQTKEEDISG